MRKLKKIIWYARIEWNYRFIYYYRKKIKPLLANGIPKVDSAEYAEVLRLNDINNEYCSRVSILTHQYQNF